MSEKVTFWFDVSCPFCWITSRWIKEVEQVRDITIDWVPMSLSVLNDGRDLDPDYMKKMEANWGPARVFAAVATREPEKLDELYTILGTKIHHGQQGGKQGYGAYNELIREALSPTPDSTPPTPTWPTPTPSTISCGPSTKPPWTRSATTWARPW